MDSKLAARCGLPSPPQTPPNAPAPQAPAGIDISRTARTHSGTLSACRVYEARPEHCRTFPFWPEVLEDERVLREVQRFCPGIEV